MTTQAYRLELASKHGKWRPVKRGRTLSLAKIVFKGIDGLVSGYHSYLATVRLFQMESHTHGAFAVPLDFWTLKLPTAGNMYHFLVALSAAVSLARFTMPNRLLTDVRSDILTVLRRGLAMKLIVVTSSSVCGGRVRIYRRSISSDCRAKGGRRMWMKVTNGEVVYATNTNGTMAERAASMS
jgi:hypothetical protein